MKMPYVALISYFLVTPLFAQSPASEPALSPLDQQVASLKIDVPRIGEIWKLVAANSDQPTKRIHDEFWGLILTRIRVSPMALKKEFTEELDGGMLVQIAFWESLRLSAKSHRVIVTKEFAALRNNYAKAKFTSDYTKVQDAMLIAASTGQPYILRDGQSANITAQIADEKLLRMNELKARLEKLCDPNWRD